MIVIPAIDIRGGKVVRLIQGLADQETVYLDSPLAVAKKWAAAGAELIHIVDLDGAFEGKLKSIEIIKSITKSIKAKIEVGGGIRDEETIKLALESGAEKVVIGTKALDEKFIAKISAKYGDRIVVGIDTMNGMVHTNGWLSRTGVKATDLVKTIEQFGIKRVNYTDISKDGMLGGPSIGRLKDFLHAATLQVVTSGGIATLDDVRELKSLEDDGLVGMIIGKALYEDKIDLAEAIKICSRKE